MGHQRLGTLPDTAPWRTVVGLVAGGAELAAVAAATTEAANHGLERARHDPGVAVSFLALTQVVLAARAESFTDALGDAGFRVRDEPEAYELLAAFSDTVDRRLSSTQRTDLGEMSKLAAVEALTRLLSDRASSLYGTTPKEVRVAARSMSTQVGFSRLAHEYYACFTRRFLTYHLDRELGLHVGGNGVFDTPAEHNHFVDRLSVHCREVAAITTTYAGDWYSKANFEGGITRAKARQFVDHCLQKIAKELRRRGTAA